MKIRIHFPTTEAGNRVLKEKIAETHAKMIKDYIEKLRCSPEDKVKLFNEIKEDIRIEAMKEKL
ncbi:hypothetical protein [Paramaledivibacter caminithermalis]|jgi:hypothetical protein|uniref:Uncharacterized protein n=1 Tax=Paramaledivibacter caminithermalis (strain DSM 15212 / CIP 107654 / DViRD3) TaxID=1121301 RepID=A0A1M6JRZ2_PARC5|nr:hypothetical protein [Paramaledivibacter caminithermalis]SHJ49474.1 hypothetical protein SAMN02745912_00121 [Paramaledivibacter caminithermalis DSM 15212]